MVQDQTLHFFRNRSDESSRQKHPLSNCHLRLAKAQKIEAADVTVNYLFPVQADVPPDRTRLLYFDSERAQIDCLNTLLNVQGFENQLD